MHEWICKCLFAYGTWLRDRRQPWLSLHPGCWGRRLITIIDGVRYLLWLPDLINTSHYSGAVQEGGERDTAEDCSPGHACSPLRQTAFYTRHSHLSDSSLFFCSNNPSDPHNTRASHININRSGCSSNTHLPVLHLLSEIPPRDSV